MRHQSCTSVMVMDASASAATRRCQRTTCVMIKGKFSINVMKWSLRSSWRFHRPFRSQTSARKHASTLSCFCACSQAHLFYPFRSRHWRKASCRSSDCVTPWVAAAILKSRLNSAGTRKLSATCPVGSGLVRLLRVSKRSGGSPLVSCRRGGGGV
jgi:hypothetical protein